MGFCRIVFGNSVYPLGGNAVTREYRAWSYKLEVRTVSGAHLHLFRVPSRQEGVYLII